MEKEFLEQTDIPEYRTYEGNIDVYHEGRLQLGNETRNRGQSWRGDGQGVGDQVICGHRLRLKIDDRMPTT